MKSYKGVVGLSLLLTAMAAIGLPASAAQLEAKTAVLVHGAFADGSSWQRVIPFLEKAGLAVLPDGGRRADHQGSGVMECRFREQ
jgi:hypothetical protein